MMKQRKADVRTLRVQTICEFKTDSALHGLLVEEIIIHTSDTLSETVTPAIRDAVLEAVDINGEYS